MNNQLEVIVQDSGLDITKAEYILEKFRSYFDIAAEWETKAKTIVVSSAEQKADMQMARVGRLFLREKRLAVEKSRKELKEQSLREGKAIDGIANVLKALIIPIEEYLDKQENFVKIQEDEKREAVRLEVEKRMEEERIAKEKAEAEERERIRVENVRLKKEAEQREAAMAEERKAAELKAAQERAKAEAEKKAIEENARREREQTAREEKVKRDAAIDIERANAERERKTAEEKARKEREAIEKEMEQQRALEEKKRQEAELKAQEERKAAELLIKKEKEKRLRLEGILKNGIECPHCGKHVEIK